MSADKPDLLHLAQLSGVRTDPVVLELLVELIAQGVQPKDVVAFLRAVISRAPLASSSKHPAAVAGASSSSSGTAARRLSSSGLQR